MNFSYSFSVIILFFLQLFSQSAYKNKQTITPHLFSLVFVHIGPELPPYISIALHQARLFNPYCPIYLLSSKEALKKGNDFLKKHEELISIDYETIPKTKEHKDFLRTVHFNFQTKWLNNFFTAASERLFVLFDFIKHFNMQNVFHLENDVMLYIDLEKAFPIFKKNCTLAMPFDHDKRALLSFVYIKNTQALYPLTSCFAKNASKGYTDMHIPPLLIQENNNLIQKLPIIMPDYVKKHPLRNLLNERPQRTEDYYEHYKKFNCIFDAAAIGQYLGGTPPQPFVQIINETAVFNPSHFEYVWGKDCQGRKIPYAIFDNKKHLIANLHIHSKKLNYF
jgi:hypothetical protein